MHQPDNNNLLGPNAGSLAPDHQVSSPDFLDYLAIIIKRRKLIGYITVGVTVLTAIITLLMPNIYTAKAKLLPPQQQSGLLSAAMMQGALAAIGGDSLVGESKSAKLYAEMLKIESIRDPIIERFKLKEIYKKKYRQDVYKEMNKNIIITTGKEGIISITVDDKDAKRAAEIANALVDELKKLTSKMNMTGAGNNRAFLEERITSTKKELLDAENELKAFQSKYKMIDAQSQGGATMGVLTQLTAQITMQEIQLNTLLRSLSESSQEVKNQRQAIAALRNQIAKFEKSGSGVVPGFEKVPERGQEYLHLMRRFKTAEAVFEMLTKQYEMARLNAENDVSTIQVVQNAIVPERKSKPVRRKIVTAALFISLLGSCVLALFMENFGKMSEGEKDRWKSLLRSAPVVEK